MLVLALSLLLQSPDISPAVLLTAPPVLAEHEGVEDVARDVTLAAIGRAIRSGRFEEAATSLEIVSENYAGQRDNELNVLRAELAIEQGLIADASKIMASVERDASLHCRIARINGLTAAARDQRDVAIDLLGEVAEDCAADWRVWTGLGILLGEQHEAAASRFAFTKAFSLSDRPEVRRLYARTLIDLDDPLSAARELQLHLSRYSHDREARLLLDFANAMRGLEPDRMADEPNESWASRLAEAGQGARRAGHTDLARALFAQALLVSPRYDVRLLAEAKAP